ncbi:flagellar basal body-associated FliL family protein [Paenibacillus montanisoli]|uniref:Flagellar protein FliL n=1 Tax=Paenibacillus montanisoli TaxID=2081970 RepID=A0A328U383_9BACL|nr:flagellar basal body-associated FliL family protein [Paenibacillus montanisoli]RAP76253.1 flagellar basal body protein FliL [Paenibacillus montanisoli]
MKKMLPWLITILLAITLIAIVAVILYKSMMSEEPKDAAGKAASNAEAVQAEMLDADERVELTSEIKDIKTNLADPEYIAVLGLAFQLDEKSTKEDFDKISNIQIKPIIIRTLSDMKPEQINGSAGKDELCAKLLNLINPVLPEGKLVKIEVTDYIVTRL